MPWRDGPGGGFTGADVPPWLPFGDTASYNLGDQRDDPDSTVNMVRELIDLRRREPALHGGSYRSLAAPPDTWAWRRGERLMVLVSMSDDGAAMDNVEGTVLFCTERRRRGESVDGGLRVGRWEAVVVDTGTAAGQVR
jgi:glycosidase